MIYDWYVTGKQDADNTCDPAEDVDFCTLRIEGLAIAERARDDGDLPADADLALYGDAWARGYRDAHAWARNDYMINALSD